MAIETAPTKPKLGYLQYRLSRALEVPRAYVSMRTCSPTELNDLHSSFIAAIEKNSDTYVCIHDVVEELAKKLRLPKNQLKWRHFDDYTFLFSMPNKAARDRFLQGTSSMYFGDAAVTFSAWMPTTGQLKRPCTFKV